LRQLKYSDTFKITYNESIPSSSFLHSFFPRQVSTNESSSTTFQHREHVYYLWRSCNGTEVKSCSALSLDYQTLAEFLSNDYQELNYGLEQHLQRILNTLRYIGRVHLAIVILLLGTICLIVAAYFLSWLPLTSLLPLSALFASTAGLLTSAAYMTATAMALSGIIRVVWHNSPAVVVQIGVQMLLFVWFSFGACFGAAVLWSSSILCCWRII
jgi:hypothetical protein